MEQEHVGAVRGVPGRPPAVQDLVGSRGGVATATLARLGVQYRLQSGGERLVLLDAPTHRDRVAQQQRALDALWLPCLDLIATETERVDGELAVELSVSIHVTADRTGSQDPRQARARAPDIGEFRVPSHRERVAAQEMQEPLGEQESDHYGDDQEGQVGKDAPGSAAPRRPVLRTL